MTIVPVDITAGSSSKTTDAFSPNPVNVNVGDTVMWTNKDSIVHTVTSGIPGQPDGKFDSSPGFNSLMGPRQKFTHKFTNPGEYPYFCALHPNMVGVIIVEAKEEVELTVSTDKAEYSLGEVVKISGRIMGASPSQPLLIKVVDPADETARIDQANAFPDGSFNYEFRTGGSMQLPGTHAVIVSYKTTEAQTEFRFNPEVEGTVITIHAAANRDSFFDPLEVTIKPDSKVTFTNEDLVPHWIVSGGRTTAETGGAFDTELIPPGSSKTITPQHIGKFEYFCMLHPSHFGIINVIDEEIVIGGEVVPVAEPAGTDILETIEEQLKLAIFQTAFLERHYGAKTLAQVDYTQVTPVLKRQLTIVFWDIRGFTRHCDELGELQDLVADFVRDYTKIARDLIDEHNGMFDKSMGDGIMAVFGVPSAGEHKDAENAIRCAIQFRKSFKKLKSDWIRTLQKKGHRKPVSIGLGCGINSGLATFGRIGADKSDQLTVLGSTVNKAQRLEHHAKSDEIIISLSTKLTMKKKFSLSKERSKSFKGLGTLKFYYVK